MIHVPTVVGVDVTNVKFNITKRRDKMKSNTLRKLSGILLFIYSIPLSLADDDTIIDDTLRPNLKAGLLGLPSEVLAWISWAISVVFAIAIAIIIILTIREAILAWWSQKQGRIKERTIHIERVFYGVGILIAMIIAVLIIIFLASNV